LYINFENPDLIIDPVVYGGTQEGGIRPGTLNVSGIVGLGKACELAQEFLKDENEKIKQLRDYLIEKILKAVPQAQLNGHPTKRLCGNASFSFKNLSPSAFAGVQDIAISSSSACSSACAEPSSTLKAIGHTDELARATLRFGIGRFNSAEEIDYACNKVIEIANKNMRPT
ncbi:MAG: aminotransferase class V-fold PLP-dependent enzyme, partial [Bdellovibrionales bacterium]|nr:aminotransferase class V-fold PLP-dependent enzyme [Bdellovibrionales bacterium]